MKHLTPILTNTLVVCALFALAVLAFAKVPGLANQDTPGLLVGFGVVLALALLISIIREVGDDQAR